MTKVEILKRVIEKAHKFGDLIIMTSKKKDWDNLLKDNAYYGLIFSHKFAKIFWGDGDGWWMFYEVNDPYWECDEFSAAFIGKRWQYHLQQMALESNPLNYLKKFL